MMKEPTIEEVLKLVEFERKSGSLRVRKVCGDVYGNVEGRVKGDVWGSVDGNVEGNVCGDVWGDVRGNVCGDVWGNVCGDVWGNVYGEISGREWQFIETPKEKIIRLIREGKGEEAIKVLEEQE